MVLGGGRRRVPEHDSAPPAHRRRTPQRAPAHPQRAPAHPRRIRSWRPVVSEVPRQPLHGGNTIRMVSLVGTHRKCHGYSVQPLKARTSAIVAHAHALQMAHTDAFAQRHYHRPAAYQDGKCPGAFVPTSIPCKVVAKLS